MNIPLSVLLPVYNAENSLWQAVEETLEILPELTERFELTILDDGSTDDTAEVAYDMAARYPQVRVIRHPVRLGLAETIQTGLDQNESEIILIGDEDYCLAPDDLRMLWQLRETQRRLLAYADGLTVRRDARLEKLLAWQSQRHPCRAFQIIHRQAFEHLRLQQAAEMMRRLDRTSAIKRPATPAVSSRGNLWGPKPSEKTGRMTWGG